MRAAPCWRRGPLVVFLPDVEGGRTMRRPAASVGAVGVELGPEGAELTLVLSVWEKPTHGAQNSDNRRRAALAANDDVDGRPQAPELPFYLSR